VGQPEEQSYQEEYDEDRQQDHPESRDGFRHRRLDELDRTFLLVLLRLCLVCRAKHCRRQSQHLCPFGIIGGLWYPSFRPEFVSARLADCRLFERHRPTLRTPFDLSCTTHNALSQQFYCNKTCRKSVRCSASVWPSQSVISALRLSWQQWCLRP
jgi:hypothetical protein